VEDVSVEKEAKDKNQEYEEILKKIKGPSFTLMYLLLIALLFTISVALYSIVQLKALEKSHQQDISNIESTLACIETLPNKLYGAGGKKSELNITIEHPKIFTDQEDYLGEIIPIIQEQNAQAYDNLSNNLTLFSILIALIALALPIFSYAFIQKDQMKRIDTQHLLLNKKVDTKTSELVIGYTEFNAAATQKIADLDTKFTSLNGIIDSKMDELNQKQTKLEKDFETAIDDIRKQIEQTQEVTSSVIPNPKGNDVVEIKPTDETPAATARALFLGARINMIKEKYDEALKQIDNAIGLEPNNASYYSVRGAILHELKRYKDAIYDENKAIDLEPNNARYYDNRGATLHEMKQYEDAVKDSNKAIDLEQNNADYYDNRAVTLYNLKRHEDALKDTNKAIDFKPNNARYYDNRGAILRGLKRYKEAQTDIENALLLEPNNVEFLIDLSYTLYKRGLYKQALECCAELGDDIASYNLALRARAMSTLKLAQQQGSKISREERELIMNDLNKAIEIDLENRYSLLDQAQAFFLLQDYDSMRESLEKAKDIDPDEPETYHWLAEYYRAIGDGENATLNDRLADEKGYISEPKE